MNFFSLFKRKLIYKFKRKILIDTDNIKLDNLDDLFHYYGSDKANVFKISNKPGHGYSKFYEKKLDRFKNKKINILEIGSFAGASAAAFAKYFPDSNVFCFDINISNFKFRSKNIQVFGIDINNKKIVAQTLKFIFEKYQFSNFDLIIDDGSHNLSDILAGLKLFYKFLKMKGIYIIEDFKHPNYYKYNRNINHILIDDMLKNLEMKNIFNSSVFNEEDQKTLISSIEKIEVFKGNLENSDISFITKS